MVIDLTNLSCENCPAIHLRDTQLLKIIKWEALREKVVSSMKQIDLFLLGESNPANRFFYDKETNYSYNGLRYFLRQELVDGGSEDQLFNYLIEKSILLVDCAICPLYQLDDQCDKVLAATFCLLKNMMPYLNLNPKAPIITIFPLGRGFSKRSIPDITKRVVGHFRFPKEKKHLSGLNKKIEDSLKRGNSI
jgi:hypothetical protein